MQNLILEKLKEIERMEQVRILHAVESGSRAWGFASPDSDYDVRFIYVREPAYYMKLEKTRDVIEWQLDETLDINGWDLQKALRLLRKSNPTLFEWASSPVVYHTTPEWKNISAVFPDYFLSKSGMHHYLSMAEGNYREYLKRDIVRLKKYLYVLRPIFACQWILDKGSPPPMLFSKLVATQANPELAIEIQKLLDVKINVSEKEEMPRIEPLNQFIENTLPILKRKAEEFPANKSGNWSTLNKLFLNIVK